MKASGRAASFAICWLSWVAAVPAQGPELVSVPFDSERWVMAGGRVVDHLGRPALAGGASLGDVVFRDGTVEVEVAVTGATSYPGVDFRMQPNRDGESVYLRPHRMSRYGDAVQYAPKAAGSSSWQLYNGDGATAGYDLPAGEWFRLRIEVLGSRARVFVGDREQPVLLVDHLSSEVRSGGLALAAPPDGSAFFSNFRYSLEPPSDFGPRAWRDQAAGMLSGWQVSEVLPREMAEADGLPSDERLSGLEWKPVMADPTGLVDLSRAVARTGPRPDTVLVRTEIHSDRALVRPLDIGYSDHLTLYLNGRPMFTGRSAYRERDPSFLGIVGPFDTVFLPLDVGVNRLVLKVTEAFGGWGVLARWGDATYRSPGVETVWRTPPDFRVPESVAWDPTRGVFYVSNYDGYNPSPDEGRQSIARISADGATIEMDWVTGLRNPVGLAVSGDDLWAAERGGLVRVDLATSLVADRHALPSPGFPNDVAVDAGGRVYVSDPRVGVIYRLADDGLEVWLEGLEQPNGVHVLGDELLIGVNGDHSIRAADLGTRAVRTIVRLGPGLIDGVQTDELGNILVSQWEGRVVRIEPDGTVEKLLDTSVVEQQCADFDYVPEQQLLVIPTFLDGRVVAYRVGAGQAPEAEARTSSNP